MNNRGIFFNAKFILSIVVFLIADISFIIYLKLYLYGLNTNTISIINVAQKYINGDIVNAINGAFAPLSSWLLIPFLLSGCSPVLAVYLINLFLGILLFIGVRLLSLRFEISESIRNIMSFVMIPIVLQFALRDHIPDLLVVCTLVFYLYFIFDMNYIDKLRNGSLSGLICAIGYMGKAYVFPFFVAHFLTMNIFHCFGQKEKKKHILKNAIAGILVFFVISGLWIAALYYKYGEITIATSGEYNHRVMGPEVTVHQGLSWQGFEGWRNYIRKGHPVYDQGFFPPTNDTAISIWEDFTYLTPYLKEWSPFESKDYFKYQLKHIAKNIYYTIGIFEGSFSLLSFAIITVYVVIYLFPLNMQILRTNGFYSLFTIVLYSGGYILLHPDERYSWTLNLMLLLMGCHLVHILFKNNFFNPIRKKIMMFFLVFSFLLVPLQNIFSKGAPDSRLYMIAKQLQRYDLRGRVASDDNFSETLKMLFYTGMNFKYYGQAKKDISDEDLLSELQKYKIDYYIIWTKPGVSNHPTFLSQYKAIAIDGLFGEDDLVPDLRIYSLNNKT